MFLPLKDDNPSSTFPAVTLGLILANLWVFYHQVFLDPVEAERFIYQWGAIPYQIFRGEVLREYPVIPLPLTIFSSMFLHGGFLHLFGNMLYLWIFGNNVEDKLGHFRFVLFYLLCGLLASLVQLLSDPRSAVPLIGASGAVAGVLGAYLVCFPGARILTLFFIFIFIKLIHLPALFVLGSWFLLQLLGIWGGAISSVAFYAHVAGFVSGTILVKAFQPARARRRR
ncbi:MAG TPA: rhomboid family intramembrane serine protease [Thermodesulfobacteriota bacterium]|nr:rhomboid family intramembrane serine protease [Thermodesulfobacteriota bacterium]